MDVRKAAARDVDAVLELAVAFYAEDGFATGRDQLSQHLDRLMVSEAARVAVVEDHGGLAAFAVSTSSYGLENGLVAELEDLYVTPADRRRGVAQALIEDSTRWAAALGAAHLNIVIAPNGLDVRHLYRYYAARGFVDQGRHLMTRPLTGGGH